MWIVYDLTAVPSHAALAFSAFAVTHVEFNKAYRERVAQVCRGFVVVLPSPSLRPLLQHILRATPPTQPVAFVRFYDDVAAHLALQGLENADSGARPRVRSDAPADVVAGADGGSA